MKDLEERTIRMTADEWRMLRSLAIKSTHQSDQGHLRFLVRDAFQKKAARAELRRSSLTKGVTR